MLPQMVFFVNIVFLTLLRLPLIFRKQQRVMRSADTPTGAEQTQQNSSLVTRHLVLDMLILTRSALQAMHEQGRASYPNECCGLLIGQFHNEGRVAAEAWPTPNEWTDDVPLAENEDAHSLRDRFYISPHAYLQAQRQALRRDLEIVGCYHTHPDDRAWPSERDRIGAAGVGGGSDFSFVIVSVLDGVPADVASALLSPTGGEWLPEELIIREEAWQ